MNGGIELVQKIALLRYRGFVVCESYEHYALMWKPGYRRHLLQVSQNGEVKLLRFNYS